MQPPTKAHLMLLEKVINTAKEMDGDPVLFLTHTQDRKKNPLPWELKVKYIKAAVGNQINVCEDDGVKTAFDFLVWVNDHQYKKVIIIVGGDRVEEFKTFFEKYNGQETPRGKYTFDDIKVVSAGARDPDGEGVSSYSATKARNAALDGDFETFKQIVGVNSEKLASDIFNTLRKFMGLGENVINTTSVSLNKRELTHFFKDLPESVVWDLLEGISLQEAAVLHYLGACIDIDDRGNNYGFDPTEFAQAEERAVEEKIDLDSREFWNRAVAPSEVRSALLNNLKVWYAYDSILGVSWAYDPDEDIHYIFEGTPLHEGVELTPPSEELNRLVYDIGQNDDDRFKQSYEDDIELARRDGYFESPSDFDEAASRSVKYITFKFPPELVGFSDIHSTSQYSHVLTGFGRGVIGPNREVKIGPAGSSHRDLSKTLGDTKRFYWGYSREKETVYVVSKNAMDTDILKNKKILMVILSNVFDLVKLSVAPGGLKIVEAAQVKTKTAAKKKK